MGAHDILDVQLVMGYEPTMVIRSMEKGVQTGRRGYTPLQDACKSRWGGRTLSLKEGTGEPKRRGGRWKKFFWGKVLGEKGRKTFIFHIGRPEILKRYECRKGGGGGDLEL